MAGREGEATITARDLAERLGATVEGDGGRPIDGVAPLGSAGPSDVSFLADAKRVKDLSASRAGTVIVPLDVDPATDATLLRITHPRVAFARTVAWFHPPKRPAAEVHPTAVVDPTARLGTDVHVGAYVVIGPRARIGDRTVLHPHVTIYEDAVVGAGSVLHAQAVLREGVILGERCVLQPGAVVGADGFGYEITPEGSWLFVPQIGTARLGDDVELGANTCVDRGALDDTVVADGTKIDNLAQIGHNCVIGPHCLVCGQVGLAGSTTLGHHVVLGGQVGVAGHLAIGDAARVAGGAGVIADLEGGKEYGGTPAIEFRTAAAVHLATQRLPDLIKQLRALERRLAALEAAPPAS